MNHTEELLQFVKGLLTDPLFRNEIIAALKESGYHLLRPADLTPTPFPIGSSALEAIVRHMMHEGFNANQIAERLSSLGFVSEKTGKPFSVSHIIMHIHKPGQ